ncbi:hypothetical protein QNO21_08380 [Microbacterium sp. zg-Y818]|uniref:hypothetical protein n=1 Tax=unclassified Microbacterium TaxID=2609290 RepID=UPI00214C5583|nr:MULTISPECIES: hypothetical protein [unclassified Microbacterium]MCR2801320.1 hypothetical protein [Microbacterium sp. zg.Y818]WIM21149.1 hypothetical protein QNO21_08380 [Microbacterium sp. zg-Y818]
MPANPPVPEGERARRTAGQALERLLFEEDPLHICCDGVNIDEYRPEAQTIAARMDAAVSLEDTLTIVHEEFVIWFGHDTAGPRRRYRRIAERTWELWRDR